MRNGEMTEDRIYQQFSVKGGRWQWTGKYDGYAHRRDGPARIRTVPNRYQKVVWAVRGRNVYLAYTNRGIDDGPR